MTEATDRAEKPHARRNVGWNAVGKGNRTAAIDHLRRAAGKDHHRVWRLGLWLCEQGRAAEAREVWNQLPSASEKSGDMAMVCAQSDLEDEALYWLEQAKRMGEQRPLYEMGKAFAGQGDLRRARRWYAREFAPEAESLDEPLDDPDLDETITAYSGALEAFADTGELTADAQQRLAQLRAHLRDLSVSRIRDWAASSAPAATGILLTGEGGYTLASGLRYVYGALHSPMDLDDAKLACYLMGIHPDDLALLGEVKEGPRGWGDGAYVELTLNPKPGLQFATLTCTVTDGDIEYELDDPHDMWGMVETVTSMRMSGFFDPDWESESLATSMVVVCTGQPREEGMGYSLTVNGDDAAVRGGLFHVKEYSRQVQQSIMDRIDPKSVLGWRWAEDADEESAT